MRKWLRTGNGVARSVGSVCHRSSTSAVHSAFQAPPLQPQQQVVVTARHVSIAHGIEGPNHAAVTACANGAHSVGDAARMIRYGDVDVMLAGDSESSVNVVSIAGFCRFNENPQSSSRPFDKDRDGFVYIMGVGARVLVLEELEHAQQRGARIYAEIRGYGMSGDAYHITQPSDDGRGAILAMTSVLNQSVSLPNEVDYINAHAISTPLGYTIEARAMKIVFEKHITSGGLVFSSTKGATGHLLGAAGAVEAILVFNFGTSSYCGSSNFDSGGT